MTSPKAALSIFQQWRKESNLKIPESPLSATSPANHADSDEEIISVSVVKPVTVPKSERIAAIFAYWLTADKNIQEIMKDSLLPMYNEVKI